MDDQQRLDQAAALLREAAGLLEPVPAAGIAAARLAHAIDGVEQMRIEGCVLREPQRPFDERP